MLPLLEKGVAQNDAAAIVTLLENMVECVEGRARDEEQQRKACSGVEEPSTSARGKSSHVRSGRTAAFKLRVLEKFDELEALEQEQGLEGTTARQLCSDIFGVAPSLISKWKKPATRALLQTQHKERQRRGATFCRKGRIGTQKGTFKQAESAVHQAVLKRRSKALVVNGLWIRTAMRIEVKKQMQNTQEPSSKLRAAFEKFRASPSWLWRFCRRWRLALLQRTNVKGKSVVEMLPALRRWHACLRARLNRPTPGREKEVDPKWWRWKLEHRYGVDQVPNPLCNFKLETYDVKGTKSIRIAVGKDGSDRKRFCTFQILHRFTGNRAPGTSPSRDPTHQPQLCICFRGKGLRISKEERAAWDPRVIVQFQQKAWYDEVTTLEWIERHLSKVVSLSEESGLFADGLKSQTTKVPRCPGS